MTDSTTAIAVGLSLGVGFFGKVLWAFFTDDKKKFPEITKKLDELTDIFNKQDKNITEEFHIFSDKLERHSSEFNQRFHELEKSLISNYVRKEDLNTISDRYSILRDEVKDSVRDMDMLQSQLDELTKRLNSSSERRL